MHPSTRLSAVPTQRAHCQLARGVRPLGAALALAACLNAGLAFGHTSATTRHAVAPAASSCAHCGVVESIQTRKDLGRPNGTGAVVGGVIGGVVGNQLGGGSGKTAMTVLGAVGGGVAGNQVEKHVKSHTVYDVRVRMDDGSRRTVTLDSLPARRGDRVAVEGNGLHRVSSQVARK